MGSLFVYISLNSVILENALCKQILSYIKLGIFKTKIIKKRQSINIINQLSTQLSYVGIMYLMLMKASSPPVCSSSYKVYEMRSPKFTLFL